MHKMAVNMLKIIGKMASKKAVFDDLSKNSTKSAEKMIILPVHMLSEADLWPIYGQYMLILARSLIYRHICNPPSLYAGNKVSEPTLGLPRGLHGPCGPLLAASQLSYSLTR